MCHIYVCIYTIIYKTFSLSIHPSMNNEHLGCLHTLVIVIMLQWAWEYRYLIEIMISFPLDIFLEVGLLDHIVVPSIISWETYTLFSIVAVPVYTLTNSAKDFPFLHVNTCYLVFLIRAIITNMKCCLVVLICISLMITVVEYLCMYLLVICMYSSLKCLFRSFAHFLKKIFIFPYLFIWLHRVSVSEHGIFIEAWGIFHFSMWALRCGARASL